MVEPMLLRNAASGAIMARGRGAPAMAKHVPDTAESVVAAAFGCDAALAAIVAEKARYRDYPARATIVEGGAALDALYLMLSGHARMRAFSFDGRLIVVEDFRGGDIFGEGGLFQRHIAPGEVAAVLPVSAAAFPTAVFLALMASYSVIALAVSRLLVARLGETTRRLVEGATLSAVGRVHAELLRQARAGEGMTIRPAPVLATLALTVQSTRETVSRTISTLQKRGIIRRDEESLTVVAPHRLEELIY